MRCPNLYFPPQSGQELNPCHIGDLHRSLRGSMAVSTAPPDWEKESMYAVGRGGGGKERAVNPPLCFFPNISPTAPHRPHHNLHAIFPSPILFHRPLPITERAHSPSQQTTRLTTATAPFDSRIDAASTHRTFQQGRCSSP